MEVRIQANAPLVSLVFWSLMPWLAVLVGTLLVLLATGLVDEDATIKDRKSMGEAKCRKERGDYYGYEKYATYRQKFARVAAEQHEADAKLKAEQHLIQKHKQQGKERRQWLMTALGHDSGKHGNFEG